LGEAHFAAAFQDSQIQGPEVRTQEDISHLLLAQERLPNNAAVLRELAVRYERLGRIQEAAESSERAVELVPRSALYRFQAGDHARLLGAFDAADDHLRMATALSTGAPEGLSPIFRSRFFLELARGGGKEGIQRLLSEEMDRGQVSSLALRNRLEEFPELLAGGEFDEFVASLSPEAPDPGLRCTCYELKAWAHEAGSRPEMAKIYWDSLSAELQDSPTPSGNDWGKTLRDVRLSLALARAGDEMRARETLEAIPIPTTRSTSEWQFLHLRAQAYASLGDAGPAVEDLEVLLRSPTGVTVGTLRGRLFWEPIRNRPEFQSLTLG
jgi:tetratricopeptide (TPR) repeat protein